MEKKEKKIFEEIKENQFEIESFEKQSELKKRDSEFENDTEKKIRKSFEEKKKSK